MRVHDTSNVVPASTSVIKGVIVILLTAKSASILLIAIVKFLSTLKPALSVERTRMSWLVFVS